MVKLPIEYARSCMDLSTYEINDNIVTARQLRSSYDPFLTRLSDWIKNALIPKMEVGEVIRNDSALKPGFWARAVETHAQTHVFHWNHWELQSSFSRCHVVLSH